MAEEETKKDTSKTVKKEEKIAKNSIKDIIYNNYKKEKTIKIFSIIIVVNYLEKKKKKKKNFIYFFKKKKYFNKKI